MPPAPGLFSTTTVRPAALAHAWLADRTMVSTPDPGPTGNIRLMGRSLCENAAKGMAAAAAPNAARICRRVELMFDDFMLSPFVIDGFGRLAAKALGNCTLRSKVLSFFFRITQLGKKFAGVLSQYGWVQAYAQAIARHA